VSAAVVDSSALIFLAKLHRLDVLGVFAPVLSTREVIDEVEAGMASGHRDALSVQSALDKRHILVRRTPSAPASLAHLGQGERSVLALARRVPNSTAVIDDLGAIKAAHSIGVQARSTPFVLLDNVSAGRIARSDYQRLLDELLGAGYFLAPRLYVRLLEEAGRA
jgi:predicted nucleic acid-binding protein